MWSPRERIYVVEAPMGTLIIYRCASTHTHIAPRFQRKIWSRRVPRSTCFLKCAHIHVYVHTCAICDSKMHATCDNAATSAAMQNIPIYGIAKLLIYRLRPRGLCAVSSFPFRRPPLSSPFFFSSVLCSRIISFYILAVMTVAVICADAPVDHSSTTALFTDIIREPFEALSVSLRRDNTRRVHPVPTLFQRQSVTRKSYVIMHKYGVNLAARVFAFSTRPAINCSARPVNKNRDRDLPKGRKGGKWRRGKTLLLLRGALRTKNKLAIVPFTSL